MKSIAIAVFAALASVCHGGTEFRRPIPRVASMDPLRSASVSDAQAVALVYETPLEVDYAARPYRLTPNLCELPEWSDDGRVCTLKLRPGHRFWPCKAIPEGRDVTAEDVAWSLRRLGDKANASSGAWIMRGVESVEAPDPETVRIVLKEPLYVFPWYLAMAYTAAVPREAVELYGDRFGTIAEGSGPYTLARWRRNHSMVFRRNPSHPAWTENCRSAGCQPATDRGAPADTVKYFVIDDPSTQFLMFLKGELDLLPELSQDCREAISQDLQNPGQNQQNGHHSVDSIQNSVNPVKSGLSAAPNAELHVETPLTTYYIGMNLRDRTLGGMGEKSRYLRQALNCAFDFDAWYAFRKGGVARSDTPVPPGVPARLETPFAYAHNEELAVELLRKAGYQVKEDAATGRRQTIDPATGRRLSLTYTLGRAAQQDREEAELMKSFYEKIGIDLDLKFMTWTGFLQAVDDGRVQLFRMGWAGDYPDPENFMQLFLSKNLPPGPNHAAYSNPDFDEAYERAIAARTPEERDAAWRRTQEIVREDCPWVFLYHPQRFSLVSRRIGNFIPGDFSYGMEKHLRIEQ